MNYRHAFHAGNFADVVKHAALLQLLKVLTADRRPLRVIDTHAGAGLYDLEGPEARRSQEAGEGVIRLMAAQDAPDAFKPLVEAVASLNRDGRTRRYPGSPLLIAEAIRPGDSYLACELRAEEHRALVATLRGKAGVEARCADGYRAVAEANGKAARELVLIDPPFERADDYRQAARAAGFARRRNRDAVVMIWSPLKDLETGDAFVRELEGEARGAWTIAETRIRPLTDPMRMNGCVLSVIGAPQEFDTTLGEICGWVAAGFGAGGQARIWKAG